MDSSNNSVVLVGLRHVLQDGISILDGQRLPNERSEFVFQDLLGLLKRANHGARITTEHQFVATASDIKSFEIYALMFQLLSNAYGSSLSNRIGEAYAALSALSKHETVSPKAKKTTRSFLNDLIVHIDRDEAYASQSQPEIADVA